MKKFGGNEGLIKFLKSGFGSIRETVFRENTIHYTNVVKNDESIGIRDDNPNYIEWRKKIYGTNKYPAMRTIGIGSLLWDALTQSLLKILFALCALSVIIELQVNGAKGKGWISGITSFVTYLIISIIQAWRTYNCQKKINHLSELSEKKKVSVFRNRETSVQIEQEQLVVGDIFRIETGMTIPADCILI